MPVPRLQPLEEPGGHPSSAEVPRRFEFNTTSTGMRVHRHGVTADPEALIRQDEKWLDSLESGSGEEVLCFWEATRPFVVVGYGQSIEQEVHVDRCEVCRFPILRRCSGGGTVVQGPGCLNYSLILRIVEGGPLGGITSTNAWIMERQRRAMSRLLLGAVTVAGFTDLVWSAGNENTAEPEPGRKFSGNAQRRKRQALLFHGTILHHFDLSLMDELLRMPSVQPKYRHNRPHTEFVVNTGLDPTAIRAAITCEWQAVG